MRLSVVFGLLAWAGTSLSGQPIETIENAHGRSGASLNGAWQYLLDPYEAGDYDFHMKPIAFGGLGANRTPANKGDKYELAFTELTPTLQVPGDWNTQPRTALVRRNGLAPPRLTTSRPSRAGGSSCGSAPPTTRPSST